MKKTIFMVISSIILIHFMAFTASPGRSWQQNWTPKLERIFQSSHLFLHRTEKNLWARYHLVLRDDHLLSLTLEEAEPLLERAFEEAPRRTEFESSWLLLLAAGDEELVLGRIHLSPSRVPRVDLSMFRLNQARLKLDLEVKKEASARSGSFLKGLLSTLRRGLNLEEEPQAEPPPTRPRKPGEMEF